MALYIDPESMNIYCSFFANCLAMVLFPQEDQPSTVMMIFFKDVI